MSGILSKLKMDKHHKFERFGVEITALFLVLLILMSISLFSKVKNDRVSLGSNAMYTTNFTTSRTHQKGTVEGIYSNKDKTSTLALFKFEDTKSMSTDANDYSAFLTAANVSGNPRLLNYNPSGSIYVFGTTGYIGVYLHSSSGFNVQVLDLVVRCNSEIAEVSSESSKSSKSSTADASFNKYDQFRVYFNPAAEKVTELSVLDKDEYTLADIYEETVVRKAEAEQRKVLEKDIATLYTDYQAVEAYKKTLYSLSINGLKISEQSDPYYITGDEVVKNKEKNEYTYEPATIVQGGVDFDWKSGSVSKGYLDNIVPEGMSYEDWIVEHKADAKSNDTNRDVKNIDWYLSDGSLWKTSKYNDSDIPAADAISTSINNLESAWSKYIDDKIQYQKNDLQELLDLEMEVLSVRTNYSINNSDKVITVY